MAKSGKKRSRAPVLTLFLLLLLLVAFLLPSGFLGGVLPGCGREDTAERLQVTVLRASTGEPVVGARIVVAGLRPAESDAAGKAMLDGLGPGPVRVDVSWRGRRLTTWARRAEGSIEIELDAESHRTGSVSRADGSPTEGVVRLLDRDGRELASCPIDPQGRYRLPELEEAHSLCAQVAGAAPAAVPAGDIVVTAGELRTGRLLGAGAGELEVFGLLPQPDDDGMLPFHCVWKRNGDGSYSGRLPAGTRAWASVDGLPVRLDGGDQELPGTTTAAGSVRREGGAVAAGAELLFRALLDGDFPVPLPPVRVLANAHGRFSVKGFPDVRYKVEVSATGCANRVLTDVRATGLEITLEPGFSAAGRVVDADGRPVRGAELRAVSQPDPKGVRPIVAARTGLRGRYLLEGLGGEFARVQVTAPGFLPATIDRVEPASITKTVLTRG